MALKKRIRFESRAEAEMPERIEEVWETDEDPSENNLETEKTPETDKLRFETAEESEEDSRLTVYRQRKKKKRKYDSVIPGYHPPIQMEKTSERYDSDDPNAEWEKRIQVNNYEKTKEKE